MLTSIMNGKPSPVCSRHVQAGVFALVVISSALLLPFTLSKAGAATPQTNHAPAGLINAQLAWEKPAPPDETYTISNLFVVGDALVTMAGEMGEVSAFDLRSRRFLWRGRFEHPDVHPLGTSDILVKSDDRLVRIDVQNGHAEWEHIVNNGFFGDGGWVAVAGELACAVYYSADQAIGVLQGVNRSTVVDLRDGKARSTRLPVVPLWFGLDSPPRVLYEEPQPAEWSSLQLHAHPSVTTTARPYAIGCVDLATGRRVWRTTLGSISNRRQPEFRLLMPLLGLVVFNRAADETSTELSWLDLNSGDELRKDTMPLNPARLWPVVDCNHVRRSNSARAILAATRLLFIEDNTLALVHGLPPHNVAWKVDLTGFVRKQLARRPSSYWFCETDWPFAVLTLNRYESGNAVLLVDLRNGAVCRVAADKDVLATCLDVAHKMLFVAVSDSLRAYRITIPSQGGAKARHIR